MLTCAVCITSSRNRVTYISLPSLIFFLYHISTCSFNPIPIKPNNDLDSFTPSNLSLTTAKMSFSVSVLYPQTADSTFDMAYYLDKHMPLVSQKWGPHGLQKWEVVEFVANPQDQSKPYSVQAILHWDSQVSSCWRGFLCDLRGEMDWDSREKGSF